MSIEINTAGLGHPVDRSLRALEQVEHGIEAQLEFEFQITERDRREIALATCFPDGKLILRGRLGELKQTVDPEVARCDLIQDGRRKGILYVNMLRKVCVSP